MRKNYFLFFTFLITSLSFGQDLVLTGVFDGPLTGGIPKAVEIYVINNVSDLSQYGIGSANNGGGTDGVEFVFSGSANAGDFLYIATEQPQFNAYFGFDPDFTTNAVSVNGDDAIELFGSVVDNGGGVYSGTVIDVFGNINLSGSGEVWDYLDGWAYRKTNTGPDGNTFNSDSWTYSGINATDGETSNSTATSQFPIGTYSGTAAVGKNEILGFSVFPNPVNNGKIWISTQSNANKQVKIFDILGKQVLSKNLVGKELNVSVLSKGIYILRVIEEGKTSTRKLVVK